MPRLRSVLGDPPIMRSASRLPLWPAFLLAAALAAPAGAQNLLVNPDFDEDLAGWQSLNPTITATWDALDVDDAPGSGSARVVSTQNEEGPGSGWLQLCFPVPPGAQLEVSAWAFVPIGQQSAAMPDLAVVLFDDAACADFLCGIGSPCGTVLSPQIDPLGQWLETATVFQVPAEVESARILLRPRKVELGGSAVVHFDAVFVPEPRSAAGFAAAALALVALGRLRA